MTPDDAIRRNEAAAPLPATTDAGLIFIGRIHTPWTTRGECPHQGSADGPACRIELFEPWVAALKGLDAFEHVDVLYWLDRARRDLVLQSPRDNGEVRGTFALRSPVRPNPIGLSRCTLVKVEPPFVHVRGLDCLDGTPLIDLKPERCHHTPHPAGANENAPPTT